jgi:glutamine cyclotransferase
LIFPAFVLSCAAQQAKPKPNPDFEAYEVVHAYPHDPDAYTQGLVYFDGALYESTGREGKSSIRKVDLQTGKVLQRYDLPTEYFGEGLTDWKNNLLQLTWQSGKCFVYDRSSFRLVQTFLYPGEGWGLTHDNKQLIMSDGTSVLRFLDPASFKELRHMTVTYKGRPVDNLNELEFIHGEIFANVWMMDRIAIISPENGNVRKWIDLSHLFPDRDSRDINAVLNGIAYDEKSDRIFITGKLWPKLFEIRLGP